MSATRVITPIIIGTEASSDAPQGSTLAVVRITRSRDVRVLDWALSLGGEHGTSVRVIGVWHPSWWQSVGCTNAAGIVPAFSGERRVVESLWSERCADAGAEITFAGLCGASPAICAELSRGQPAILVVSRSAVSVREGQHLLRRHPGLRVVRV